MKLLHDQAESFSIYVSRSYMCQIVLAKMCSDSQYQIVSQDSAKANAGLIL